MKIPKRKRGRQSKDAQEKFDSELYDFIQELIRINNKVDFKMGSRDWCYLLEGENIISKGEFDYAQRLINDCRKNGMLPNGFIAQEEARSFNCIEKDVDYRTPMERAEAIIDYLSYAHKSYYPKSFWDDQDCYIQMLVEKIGLRNLFMPVCEKYNIPVATARGWSSIRQRKEIVYRFKKHENDGRTPVLLYCGDFDPAGLRISDFIKSNLDEIYGATRWDTENLIIDRFGLNYDFIIENSLTWIDNLETGKKTGINDLSNPKHKDHNKEYVQSYLKAYCKKDEEGKWEGRKVEANAIVKVPEMGRELCEDTIKKYISSDAVDIHQEYINKEQQKCREHLSQLLENI